MGANTSKSKLPRHVALIMDGNRRWAAERGLGPVDGHRAAVEKALKPVVRHAAELGIPYLTFWAFSTENRNRDKEELQGLFSIFREMLKKHLEELEKENVRIKIIGDIDWFPKDIAKLARAAVERTKDNKKITVSFALNYGGRDEILRAINRLIRDRMEGKANHSFGMGKMENGEVTEGEFAQYLDTAGMPDPDLIIRTGGEQRLSGYFPWQSVYSELYFTKTYWPDFTPEELDRALEDYLRRSRRFGGGRFEDYKRRIGLKARALAGS